MEKIRPREGLPYPLGATWDGEGVNFALFSAHASRVEVCLYDDGGECETVRVDLPDTDEIWHGSLPGVTPGSPPDRCCCFLFLKPEAAENGKAQEVGRF